MADVAALAEDERRHALPEDALRFRLAQVALRLQPRSYVGHKFRFRECNHYFLYLIVTSILLTKKKIRLPITTVQPQVFHTACIC